MNQHMVEHQDTAGHKMALSFSDLSVWCYLCDSYIDNHVSLGDLSVWYYQSDSYTIQLCRV